MGMTPARTEIEKIVSAGDLAGAAMLTWQKGESPEIACFGVRDLVNHAPVERDTIFRIASLTKPIVSTAAIMVLEERGIDLDEPITRWAPEFEAMQVLQNGAAGPDVTVPAVRTMTFDDLLTHRAGLSYAEFLTGPIRDAYQTGLGGQIDNALTPDEWIARLAALPLIAQPGTRFTYGHATDLLGFVLARIEGAPLEDVLQRRIFEPLGMTDTGFFLSLDQHKRAARPCGFDADGKPAPLDTVPGGHAWPARERDGGFVSGSSGLWSTIEDFARFARLFAEGGASSGVHLLQPETVRLMTTNRLSPAQRAEAEMLGRPLFARGHGFGLGVAVVMEPEDANPMICGGGAGSVGWPGAYGSWWQADPNDGSVLVFMCHNMCELDQFAQGIGLGAWQAIGIFQSVMAE